MEVAANREECKSRMEGEDLSYLHEPANRLTFEDYGHHNASFVNARAQRTFFVNDPPVALHTRSTYRPWAWEMEGPKYYNPYPHQVYRKKPGSNPLLNQSLESMRTTDLITHDVGVDPSDGLLKDTEWGYPGSGERGDQAEVLPRRPMTGREPAPPSYEMESRKTYMGHHQFHTWPGEAFQAQFKRANFLRVDDQPTRLPRISGKPQTLMPLMTKPLYDHRFPEDLGWAPRQDVFRLRTMHNQFGGYMTPDDWYPVTA